MSDENSKYYIQTKEPLSTVTLSAYAARRRYFFSSIVVYVAMDESSKEVEHQTVQSGDIAIELNSTYEQAVSEIEKKVEASLSQNKGFKTIKSFALTAFNPF